MHTTAHFYICPTCFAATETAPIDHPHAMIYIDLRSLEVVNQCPPTNCDGTLQTRRPAWFLIATGQAPHPRQTLYRPG